MRRAVLSVLTVVAVLGAGFAPTSRTAADGLQWRRHQHASPATAARASVAPAATRSAARFQRPSIAQRAKRPTPQEPAQLPQEEARPIKTASPQATRPAGSAPGERVAYASRKGRVRQAAVQLAQATENAAPAPQSNGAAVPPDAEIIEAPQGEAFPYSDQYIQGQPYVEGGPYLEGGPYVEATCGCPEPVCGCPDPTFDAPVCGCPAGDCVCGEVACAGECGCGDPCATHPLCFGGCVDRGAIPICIYLPPIKEAVLFGGVHGFKGALDEARDRGNFGFHEGFNLGGKMVWLPWPGLAYQFGYQATHSQLHGSDVGDSPDDHTQQFMTAGLFQRSFKGVQFGVAYDMLRDERLLATDFHQVRGLISVTNPKGGEVGFMFAASSDDEEILGRTYRPNDQYLGFWRYHGKSGGEFRIYGGGGDGNGIIGSDIFAPLNESWSLQTGFTYMIPDDGAGAAGAQEESWNVGINLVWHWGHGAKRWYKSPWRPMFNVADNGSFIVDDID